MVEICHLPKNNMYKTNKINIVPAYLLNINSHSHTKAIMFLMTAQLLSTVDLLSENKNSGKDNKKKMSQENLIFKIKTAILAIA